MNKLQTQSIAKAKQFRETIGGTIFAFPIEEDNPFSSYAIVMYHGGQFFSYPQADNLPAVSAGIFLLLELLKKTGKDADYERNVRLISYQAQMDVPSTVMRKLKRECQLAPFNKGRRRFRGDRGKW